MSLKTVAECVAVAEQLKLAEIVQRVMRGETLEMPLKLFFRHPAEFFSCHPTEVPVAWQEIVPLWDNGNFDEISAYHPVSAAFVRFCIEDPLDLSSIHKLNWQQLLIPDFIRIYEFEVSDDDFRAFARQFRVEFADETIRGYQKPWYGGLEFDEWRRRPVDQAGT